MTAQRSYRWLFVTLAVAGLALDQGSKYGMFRWLHNGGAAAEAGPFRVIPDFRGEYDLIPGWFRFTAEFDPTRPTCDCGLSGLQTWSAPVMPRVNHGALFGLGGTHKELANWVFAGVSLLAAIAIAVWATRSTAKTDRWLCVALGLILGGTVGNFYDRVVFGGVRDFLYFYKVEWPVFNVADCCLVVGAAVLLTQAVFAPATPAATAEPAAGQ
jgi:signal peptidase II